MLQKEFYKTQAWRRARYAYIQERHSVDGGLCERCGLEPGRIVHHKIWVNDHNCNNPEVSLNPHNFEYLCQTCHNKERDPAALVPGRVRYGPDGEVIRASDY
jgi:5-methylcytosine-specific restriction endonuclease McrA